MEEIKEKNIQLSFAALNPEVVSNIVKPVESDSRGTRNMIRWGENNKYPTYISGLFETAPTLRSIITGIADYVGGNNITCNVPAFSVTVNDDNETIEDIIRQLSIDYVLYGCAALNIIRNLRGEISQLYNINMKWLRSDKKNRTFYYSEQYDNKSLGRINTLVYPAYDPNQNDPSSIYFIKNDRYRTYGLPLWAASVESAEVEKRIQDFHLNEICNGFVGSYIVNLCNGVPSDTQKEEIEDNFNDKFGGSENAGRLIIAYSQDKDHSATIEAVPQTDFQDKYNALELSIKQNLFTAFRCHPLLFGIPTNGSALNKEDYAQTYALFAKTMISPLQKTFKRMFEKIFGMPDAITIEPFTINFEEDQTTNNQEIQ